MDKATRKPYRPIPGDFYWGVSSSISQEAKQRIHALAMAELKTPAGYGEETRSWIVEKLSWKEVPIFFEDPLPDTVASKFIFGGFQRAHDLGPDPVIFWKRFIAQILESAGKAQFLLYQSEVYGEPSRYESAHVVDLALPQLTSVERIEDCTYYKISQFNWQQQREMKV